MINDLITTISSLQNLSTQLNDLIPNETTHTFDIDDIMCIDTSDFTNLKLKLSYSIQQCIKTIAALLCVSSKIGRALCDLHNSPARQCSTS